MRAQSISLALSPRSRLGHHRSPQKVADEIQNPTLGIDKSPCFCTFSFLTLREDGRTVALRLPVVAGGSLGDAWKARCGHPPLATELTQQFPPLQFLPMFA